MGGTLSIFSADVVMALVEEVRRLVHSGEELPPLVQAAAAKAEDAVQCYLQEGGRLWAPDSAGRTPLHWAAAVASGRLVGALLVLGADVEARDRRGRTPLHHAALGRNAAAAGHLLWRGASAASLDFQCRTPLMCAAAMGNGPLCYLLAGDGPGPHLEAADRSLRTALHLAAGAGSAAAVRALVVRGANVNVVDGEQRVPLHCALNYFDMCQEGALPAHQYPRKSGGKSEAEGEGIDPAEATRRVVEELLEGEDAAESTCHRDKVGMTPLMWALRLHLPAVATLLMDAHEPDCGTDAFGYTALHWAAHAGDAHIAHRLLQLDFSPWEPDKLGYDSVMAAVEGRDVQTLIVMLGYGKYISHRSVMGQTALHMAVAFGDKIMTRCLLDHGASVSAVDHEGRTALFHALQMGQAGREVAMLLLAAGTYRLQGSRTDERGRTLLHAAAAGGDAEMVGELLRRGESPAVADADGESPLGCALRLRQRAAAAPLVRSSSLAPGPDRRGRTPLHWAAAAGWREEARALLQKGCDPAHRDSDGRSAVATAARCGHADLAAEMFQWSFRKESS